ncbi:hypothetical protein A6F68_01091 [Tsuneonella dongtanensis]|uniref:Uncharacterized protein n=1 Tax=Tsuneonella dongtanensis TaxID=692370 RepID=A0A1B2ABS3_9SPHN|nr:hypothetical protein A6F68_01091 [Tsuneonella dongtanensis]
MARQNGPIDAKLIERLCLEAGRLMEDTSVDLALAMPGHPRDRRAYLQRLRQTADDMADLLAAAEVLHRRGKEQSS